MPVFALKKAGTRDGGDWVTCPAPTGGEQWLLWVISLWLCYHGLWGFPHQSVIIPWLLWVPSPCSHSTMAFVGSLPMKSLHALPTYLHRIPGPFQKAFRRRSDRRPARRPPDRRPRFTPAFPGPNDIGGQLPPGPPRNVSELERSAGCGCPFSDPQK